MTAIIGATPSAAAASGPAIDPKKIGGQSKWAEKRGQIEGTPTSCSCEQTEADQPKTGANVLTDTLSAAARAVWA